MTAQTRAVLKTRFENGDTPTGTDYSDLIDSFVSLLGEEAITVNASSATFAGSVVMARTVAVSALFEQVRVSGSVSANNAWFESIIVANNVNAAEVTAQRISVSAGLFTTVSANSVVTDALRVPGAVSANSLRVDRVKTSVMEFTDIIADTTAAVSAPSSATAYLEVMVSGVAYRIPLFADGS
jgi:cytoskeletal protein CcmA (bactofilin family)